MAKTMARASAPSMLAPDTNTWRPVVTPVEPPKQTQAKRRRSSGATAAQQRDLPIDTILNDRLG